MKEEKIDKWRTPSSLIPNRGDIKTFACSDGDKTPNMAELWCHPSGGECCGGRVVGKSLNYFIKKKKKKGQHS